MNSTNSKPFFTRETVMLKLYAFWNVSYLHPKFKVTMRANITIAAQRKCDALRLFEERLGDHLQRDEYKPNCQMIGTAGKAVKEGLVSPLDF